MKYMFLFAGTDEYFAEFRAFPEDKQRAALEVVNRWRDEQTRAGRLLEGHRLQPVSTATTVRIQQPYATQSANGKNGKALVTDGPFIDAKERIGGYIIVDVPDLDAAIELAKSWPAGGTVEIRPVMDL
ncbi:MAG TPA: YciI family protein [Candidatus Dormibacteraeota bacterium]|nr:YciI family protein [Candidatus Dormibacteraeota bacterium]